MTEPVRLMKYRLQLSAEVMMQNLVNPIPLWLIALANEGGVVTYDQTAVGIEIVDPPGVTL